MAQTVGMPAASRCALVLLLASCHARPDASPPPRECTEIGCGPPFAVEFERRSDWTLGIYRVELTVDDAEVVCRQQLPLQCGQQPACSHPDVRLIEIGCALDVSQQALGGVQFVGRGPRSVVIRVFDDDVELAAASYAPTYVESRPNGPGCDPVCLSASPEPLVFEPPAVR